MFCHTEDFFIFISLIKGSNKCQKVLFSVVLLIARTYKPWIGNSLLKLKSCSERSQNAGFQPRSHHLAIVQTRPSPLMLRLVDKVLARFNCASFNSHITWRKNCVMFVLPLVRHVFFWVFIILHRLLH